MQVLSLLAGAEPPARVLAVGAHADDIEIGCGGTLLSLVRAQPGLEVWWVVLSASEARASEARSSASAFLRGARAHVEVHGFRDGYLPFDGAAVKDVFEALKERVQPDVVFAHSADDAHQDHRLVAQLAWNTFRDTVVLEYEIPKWDADLGRPNAYFPLSRAVALEKVALLERHFPTQSQKHWFDAETFTALMRLRGVESRAPDRYAEAFFARKLTFCP